MSAGRHAEVRRLFLGACRLEGTARGRWLDEECATDPDLRAEVEALLEADAEPAGPFEHTAEGAQMLVQALAHEEPSPNGADDLAPGNDPEIPGYRVEGLLGRGGMGLVYAALQVDSGRRVALKVLPPALASDEFLRRFRREVRVLGQLQHPGIAQILDSGTRETSGAHRPFFAMELVEGEPIDAYASAHQLDVAARLELVARVCDAVHYAHEKGVVHRDLKPANLLVGGDVTSDSRPGATNGVALPQPKVLDFGVARAMDADLATVTMHTAEGQLVGTLPYMSPEQAAGDPAAIDRRSDVYSIGVIAFELLAGCLPYGVRGKLVYEAVRVIREDEPSSLGSLDSSLRGDVETIVAKALEKEPARRYASAADLAEDLRRHNEHRPIRARRPSTLYQLRKFTRRNRALVGGALATLIVALAGAGIASFFAFDASRRASELERLSYRNGLAAAQGAIERSDWTEAEAFLEAAPAERRGWEHDYLRAQLPRPAAFWDPPPGPILAPPVFDADGHLAYAVTQPQARALPAGKDPTGVLCTWDLESGRLQGSLPITPDTLAANRVQIDPESKRFAEHAKDGAVRVRDLDTGRELSVVEAPVPGAQVRSSLWESGAGRLLFAGEDGIWIGDGRTWSAVGEVELLGDSGNPFLVRDRYCLDPSTSRILRFHGPSRALTLIEAETGEVLARTTLDDTPTWMSFSPEGRWIAVVGVNSSVFLLDGSTLELSRQLRGHQGRVTHVRWSPEGSRFATVGDDGTARLWTLDSPDCVTLATGDRGVDLSLRTVTFLPGGRSLLVSGLGHQVFPLPDREAARGSTVLRGHASFVYGLAFSPDGTMLASSGYRDSHVHVWDVATGRPWRVLTGPPPASDHHAVVFSDDSRRLAGDAEAATTWRLFDEDEDDADSPSWSARPRGLQELGAARLRAASEAHQAEVLCAAFHPSGTRIATGGRDRTIRIWDQESFENLLVLRGHEDYVIDVEFSPDGSLLASASGDKTIRLWDARPAGERRSSGSPGSPSTRR